MKKQARLGEKISLKFRNGYSIEVSFNKYWGKVVGVKKLYEDFGLEGGELLVFEYSGDGNFNIYIIGKDCCEVDYPTVVRSMPNTQLRKGNFFLLI